MLRRHPVVFGGMGWRGGVGSLKIQFSSAKEPYKKDLYSAKETYIFKKPTNRSHTILSLFSFNLSLSSLFALLSHFSLAVTTLARLSRLQASSYIELSCMEYRALL